MTWKSCSSCRKGIAFRSVYWECSVSTCNRKRLGMYFCTVSCWDAHLPDARHREAWAIEKRAPGEMEWQQQERAESERKVVSNAPPVRKTVSASGGEDSDLPIDVLVVVSKLKKYVKAKADMKTADNVIPELSRELRKICDRAIRVAGEQGRKTVMDRDVRDAIKLIRGS